MTTEIEQSELPYEDVTGNIQSRANLRKELTRGSIEIYKIPFNKIEEWDGYNARTVFEEIPELAESLLINGQDTPFKLIVTKDKRYLLVRGGRRKKAYELLVSQGRFNPETEVSFEAVRTDVSMEDLLVDLALSNNQSHPLSQLDLSTVAFRLKFLCGKEKSNDEIAKQLNVSRQTVDNLIRVASASDDIKHQIRTGVLSFTHALSLIANESKLKKQSDKEEAKAAQSSMYQQPGYQDPLANEIKELEELEKTPAPEEEVEESEEERQQRELREATKREQELEQLLEISDEVRVSHETLVQHIDKKLSADVLRGWSEDFIDEDSGEVITIDRKSVVAYKNTVLSEDLVKEIVGSGVETVFVYQKGKEPIAPSVITEPVAQKEKGRYDESRPEVKAIQNAIVLNDKMNIAIEKLDVPDGLKRDFSDWCKWQMNSLEEAREWIHLNKKQNKIR